MFPTLTSPTCAASCCSTFGPTTGPATPSSGAIPSPGADPQHRQLGSSPLVCPERNGMAGGVTHASGSSLPSLVEIRARCSKLSRQDPCNVRWRAARVGWKRCREGLMAGVRAFRPEDIRAIVRLRRKSFRLTEQSSDAGLAAYYQRIFFENPWRDEALPSLVYEDARGMQAGFLGVIPRPMRFGEQPIRAAVSTELMVDPAERGIAGLMLLRAFFGGPQDVSISDRANAPAREIFERLGGGTALWFSLYWVRVLCPFEYAAGRLGWRGIPTLTRPLCLLLD